jgi:hypothetical protein
MNCLECEARLQDCLDAGDLPIADRDLSEHLESCSPCRELHRSAERLVRCLALLPSPAAPVGFVERTTARILRDQTQVLRFHSVTKWSMRIAATLLVGTLGVWLAITWNRDDRPIQETPQANNAAHDKEIAIDPQAAAALLAQYGEARDRTRQVALETARNARLLWAPVEQLPDPIAPLNLQEPAISMGEVTRSVSEGLEPVTDSARRAYSMFRRMLPPAEERKKG